MSIEWHAHDPAFTHIYNVLFLFVAHYGLHIINQKFAKLVQLSRTQKANSVFPGNVTTATATQPDLGHLRKPAPMAERSNA